MEVRPGKRYDKTDVWGKGTFRKIYSPLVKNANKN